jgi:hypothetical protein
MRGRSLSLTVPRRIVCDLMHFAKGVPTIPVQRRMMLAPAAAARRASRLPWTAFFTKAFALVADEFPELRRAFCKLPWPHLYEYPTSVAHIMVKRDYEGEPAVFGLRIKNPGSLSLERIGAAIREASIAPIRTIASFEQALRFAGWPQLLRRALWWIALNCGRVRPNYFGTFGVSVYSALGAESLHPLSPLTCTLNYGVIADDGTVDVRIIYDHRVLDGATVARALARMEELLNATVCNEVTWPRLAQDTDRLAA